MAINFDPKESQKAAASGDVRRLETLYQSASAQLAELKKHVEDMGAQIAASGSNPAAIVPYGVGLQDSPIPPYGTAIQDRGVRPLYGVVDQYGSVVPLYGTSPNPPNPVPLYGVIIHDAAASGDLARMKSIASAVERHLDEVMKMKPMLEGGH